MRMRIWLALMPLVLLVGCGGGATSPDQQAALTSSPSAETSVGASVPLDDPSLPRADAAGNTPPDVLFAYIRARNRSDWKTAYALIAPPKEDYASLAQDWTDAWVPYDDFEIHETRIVEPNKALVRVTYSTIGFSSLEGVSPKEQRNVVVIREPGEWWVLEKADTIDGAWEVNFKGPYD